MRKLLEAWGWWLLGVACSVALAYLYHRKLAGDFDGIMVHVEERKRGEEPPAGF